VLGDIRARDQHGEAGRNQEDRIEKDRKAINDDHSAEERHTRRMADPGVDTDSETSEEPRQSKGSKTRTLTLTEGCREQHDTGPPRGEDQG
jgi:hypothetical protein